MIDSRPRAPTPALPDSSEPNRAREQSRRRAVSRPQATTNRQPRANLDSLAIGAPLTAALAGVLLAEGEGALGRSAGGAADAGGAARPGGGEPSSATEHGMVVARLDPAGDGGAAGDPAASTGGEIFDPVIGEDAPVLAAAASGEVAGTLSPPAPASAGVDAKVALSAGTTITLGGALPGAFGLGGGPVDADAVQSNGRIGASITGTDGDDVIHGTPYDDRLLGGAGNDTIYGYAGDDLLDGGTGNDNLFGGPGDDQLLGGSGNDRLRGGTGDDALLGGSGNDRLYGNAGRDRLDGGAGKDRLDGGPDADRLTGGTGNDTLIVDNIHDVAFGGGSGVAVSGTDTLVVRADFATHLLDQLDESRATFAFSENFDQNLPAGVAPHHQQVAGDIQNITLEGTANHDVVGDSHANRLWGNDGNNRLYGGSGDDLLKGGGGHDRLHGGGGQDRLDGGSGDDILEGGRGADLLYGEGGNDTYVIGLNDSQVDWIFDDAGHNQLNIEDGAGHLVETAVAGKHLYVVVDKNPIAMVDDYLGSEHAFDGIDAGRGTRSIDDLMAPNAGAGPALPGEAAGASTPGAAADDLLDAWLTRPSIQGGAGGDQLAGTSAPDWLSGGAGDDQLRGGGERDVLEGGGGSDVLEGGSGADRYLFRSGEAGSDEIRDVEGANVAELEGFDGAKLDGVLVDKNLVVVANNSPVFTFADFVGNEQAFAGVQVGDDFVSSEDLLA